MCLDTCCDRGIECSLSPPVSWHALDLCFELSAGLCFFSQPRSDPSGNATRWSSHQGDHLSSTDMLRSFAAFVWLELSRARRLTHLRNAAAQPLARFALENQSIWARRRRVQWGRRETSPGSRATPLTELVVACQEKGQKGLTPPPPHAGCAFVLTIGSPRMPSPPLACSAGAFRLGDFPPFDALAFGRSGFLGGLRLLSHISAAVIWLGDPHVLNAFMCPPRLTLQRRRLRQGCPRAFDAFARRRSGVLGGRRLLCKPPVG